MEIKIVILENVAGKVIGFFAMPNNYEFEKFADQVAAANRQSPDTDFKAAKKAFFDEFVRFDL